MDYKERCLVARYAMTDQKTFNDNISFIDKELQKFTKKPIHSNHQDTWDELAAIKGK